MNGLPLSVAFSSIAAVAPPARADGAILAVVIIVLIVGGLIFAWWHAAQRRKALAEWAAAHGMTYKRARDRSFPTRYAEFRSLQQGENRYAQNLMEGTFEGRPFVGFDYHYETYTHDNKGNRQTHHHYFSGVVIGSNVPLEPLFIRPEGFFDKVADFFGKGDINFESAEFSRKFHVTAPDKRWAYDVLHVRAIEFLLGRPMHTVQFGRHLVMAHQNKRFKPEQFECAAQTVAGLLDQLPEYVVKQQTGKHAG